MSNSFVKDTSDAMGSFLKNFSDNTSPADADSPHNDLAAVPGTLRTDKPDVATESLKPGGPLANMPFDANKGIETLYQKVQERYGSETQTTTGTGTAMPDANAAIERTYESVHQKAAGVELPDANKKIEEFYEQAHKKSAGLDGSEVQCDCSGAKSSN